MSRVEGARCGWHGSRFGVVANQQRMKLSAALLLSLFCTLSLYAADLSDLTYTTTNGEVAITDCDTTATGELIIPTTIGGNPVTSIETGAFRGCAMLTVITIPDHVTSIGERAFRDCTDLTSLTIPSSVTDIGNGILEECPSLITIEVDAENQNYTGLEGVLFNAEATILIVYPQAKTEHLYSIPDSVTTIVQRAFQGCNNLTVVTLPERLHTIGEHAFSECRNLTRITIPDGVTRIQSGTFLNCTSLTAIALPETLIGIGQGAFSRCSSLTDINIPQGVRAIIDFTFGNCTSLTTFTIPDNVTYIGAFAFYNCTGLTSMTIPEGVTTIGTQAFFRCTSLTSLTFRGPAPTTIYPGAFGRLADGAVANIEEQFADSFGAAGSNWNGLILNFDRPVTITRCGFLNPTTFFIEFEPAGAGYRVMNSPTLDFENAVEVTPALEPTTAGDNRFEFAASGARNFYWLEPTE